MTSVKFKEFADRNGIFQSFGLTELLPYWVWHPNTPQIGTGLVNMVAYSVSLVYKGNISQNERIKNLLQLFKCISNIFL